MTEVVVQDIDIVNNTIMGAPAGARAVAADLGGVDPATVFSDPPMNIWNIAAGTIVTAQPAADALAAATLPSKGTHLQGIQQVRCTLCLCVAYGVYSKDKGEEAGSARGDKVYMCIAYVWEAASTVGPASCARTQPPTRSQTPTPETQ